MDVPKDRFAVEVINVIQDIAEAHFVAFDLEFSGVAGRSGRRGQGKPSLQELYEETKGAAEKYQVLQVGLTIVKEDVEKGRYILHPYNFSISPLPSLAERHIRRDWTMNSGAIQFLQRNKFDFGKTLTKGVPYLSRDEAVQVRSSLLGEGRVKNVDMDLKDEDEALIKHIRTLMHQWMKESNDTRESYLNIPAETKSKGVPGALNRYQMRLAHQIVQNEFPSMKTTSMHQFIQVTDPTHPETMAIVARQIKEAEREVSRAVGFRWVLEALAGADIRGMPEEYFHAGLPRNTHPKNGLSEVETFADSLNTKLRTHRRVLIGHNCFTDLVYLTRFFDGHLPSTVIEFQQRVNSLFPAVVDTKKLASFGNGRWYDTSLEFVEEQMRSENTPVTIVPPEFDRYQVTEMQHEAGYDSLLTALIAVKLSAKMERDGEYLQEVNEAKPADIHFGLPAISANMEPPVLTPQIGTEGRLNVTSEKQDTDDNPPQQPVVPAYSETSQAPTEKLSSPFSSHTEPVVVAVKEKKSKSASWSEPAEVEKIRSTFASSTIYDVLEDGKKEDNEDEGYEADSDLESPGENERSGPQLGAAADESKDIEAMVKSGQLMPRWDKGVFWREFGNKLQVNSCKEDTCILS